MKQRVKVVFADGREEVLRVTPKLQVEIERKFERSLLECNHFEHIFYAAWLALGAAGKDRGRDFNAFLDMIESAELLPLDADEPGSPDPTQPEASSGTSSS